MANAHGGRFLLMCLVDEFARMQCKRSNQHHQKGTPLCRNHVTQSGASDASKECSHGSSPRLLNDAAEEPDASDAVSASNIYFPPETLGTPELAHCQSSKSVPVVL